MEQIKRTNHFRTLSAAIEFYADEENLTDKQISEGEVEFSIGRPEVEDGRELFVGANGRYFDKESKQCDL